MLDAFAAIKKYSMIREGDNVIACVSGGADSMALLCFLKENSRALGIAKLYACHINHGLRPDESPAEQRTVEEFCRRLGVELFVCPLDMNSRERPTGLSIENWARELRYARFSELAERLNAKIATAHSKNDRVETVIFNISRGSGISGARGVPAVNGRIIRPFITTSRADIEAYCAEKSIPFVTDSSNSDDRFTRNNIRHNIIPKLCEVNSAALDNIAFFSDNAADASDYISKQAKILLECSAVKDGYSKSALLAAHPAVRTSALLMILGENGRNRTAVSLCESAMAGSTSVQLGEGCYFFADGDAVRVGGKPAVSESFSVSADDGVHNIGGFKVDISHFTSDFIKKNKKYHNLLLKNCADCDMIKGNIHFRNRTQGEKISLAARGNTKTLKKLFGEMKVSPELRDAYPVVYDDLGAVWVYGAGVAQRVRVTENTKNIVCFSEGTGMHNDIQKILISEEEIRDKIKEMGRIITADFEGKNLIMISILKGAVVFVADLMRAVDVHTEIDFMGVSSFKGGVVSSGAVKIVKDLDISLEGRDILIVEDILDSGKTLEYIQEILWSRHPNSVKICTLLDKPSRRQSSIVADYVGFVIPDEFVVGYGLDYAEKYRNLPYIGVLKPCVYSKEDAEILGV